MSSLLDKYKNSATNSKLDALQSKLTPNAVTPEQAKAKAEAETKLIASAVTEVPEGIFTLDDRFSNIEGLQAEKFSQLLASTYQALVADEPRLATLSEEIGRNLRQYEEISYLLTPQQLGMYFDSLMKLANANIKTTKPKTNAAKTALAIEKRGGADSLDLSLNLDALK